jgi:hypothetical protein
LRQEKSASRQQPPSQNGNALPYAILGYSLPLVDAGSSGPGGLVVTLSKSSVEFFKKVAHKHHAPYQKMIRSLIGAYAARHASP